MMRNEKSGGHSERSIGIGTIEVAIWDAVAKIAGQAAASSCSPSASTAASCPAKCSVYVGGGWYAPGKAIKDLQDEMRRHLDAGYTMVKMKVGGVPLAEDLRAHRGGEIDPAAGAPSSRSTPTRNSIAARRSPTRTALAPFGCAGSRSRAIRSTLRCWRRLPMSTHPPLSTGENLFSTQDVENLVRFGGLKPRGTT